ncbi:MAG: lipoyl(octanoyl) transferase LipB [Legionellales bacterium]|nr:lipoyl(octanoyl) transferase LipB [Legionellales bacterium]
MKNIGIRYLGLVPYTHSWELMQKFSITRNASVEDEIWLLEHEPVFTLGYNGDKSHILRKTGIPLIKSDRGGNITYHAPGQLIGYLLIDLKKNKLKVHDLVRKTEQLIIHTLKDYSITSHTVKNAPGVYINNEKICSIGFRIKNGCSYHGFALNVNMDLKPFCYINPCGLDGIKITQIQAFVKNINIQDVQDKIIVNLGQHFGYTDTNVTKHDFNHESEYP